MTDDSIAATARVERALLSTLMVLGRTAVWGRVATIVPPEAIQAEAHRVIYGAIREVAKTADPDLPLVIAQLDATGQLERAGGAAYVASLLDEQACADNLIEYAKTLKARAVLRRAKR